MAGLFPEDQKFTNAKGEDLGLSALEGKKKVGLYFSAHWCPPCRGFTPNLAKAYHAIREAHPEFEIVFVTSDRDDTSFHEYLGSMPWISLPFGDPQIAPLKKSFNVKGIPMLVIVDENGDLLTDQGRNLIHDDASNDYVNVWDRFVAA